ncbi:hypothetical protein EF62_0553 [Enterococcus faecalis 62]|nr:hypothetical protein EF62_0553 [Enterococcus faecalis 62]AHI39279.1 Hypothetical protein DENG_00155 [Enterococcus faecalis DENG1]ELA01653.1 hypothetical protein OG1X_2460 [Enterococcus faecalis OG1X]ELA04165.1 hypothetical protein EFM7_2653 [Enterococcus faecalis M7]KAJ81340.1 hypothetical protein P788_0406 [Enterococcus faecalis MTUP9]
MIVLQTTLARELFLVLIFSIFSSEVQEIENSFLFAMLN